MVINEFYHGRNKCGFEFLKIENRLIWADIISIRKLFEYFFLF